MSVTESTSLNRFLYQIPNPQDVSSSIAPECHAERAFNEKMRMNFRACNVPLVPALAVLADMRRKA